MPRRLRASQEWMVCGTFSILHGTLSFARSKQLDFICTTPQHHNAATVAKVPHHCTLLVEVSSHTTQQVQKENMAARPSLPHLQHSTFPTSPPFSQIIVESLCEEILAGEWIEDRCVRYASFSALVSLLRLLCCDWCADRALPATPTTSPS